MILDRIERILIIGNGFSIINRRLGGKINQEKWIARFSKGLSHLNPEHIDDIGDYVDIVVNSRVYPPELKEIKLAGAGYVFAETLPDMANSNLRSHSLNRDRELFRDFGYGEPLPQKLSAGLAFIKMCLDNKVPEIIICGFTTNYNHNPSEPAEFCQAVKGRKESYGDFEKRNLEDDRIHDFEMEREIKTKLIDDGKIKFLKEGA